MIQTPGIKLCMHNVHITFHGFEDNTRQCFTLAWKKEITVQLNMVLISMPQVQSI